MGVEKQEIRSYVFPSEEIGRMARDWRPEDRAQSLVAESAGLTPRGITCGGEGTRKRVARRGAMVCPSLPAEHGHLA